MQISAIFWQYLSTTFVWQTSSQAHTRERELSPERFYSQAKRGLFFAILRGEMLVEEWHLNKPDELHKI